MLRTYHRIAKVALIVGIGSATVFQSNCGIQVRDAAVTGLAGFVADAVRAFFDIVIPINS